MQRANSTAIIHNFVKVVNEYLSRRLLKVNTLTETVRMILYLSLVTECRIVLELDFFDQKNSQECTNFDPEKLLSLFVHSWHL